MAATTIWIFALLIYEGHLCASGPIFPGAFNFEQVLEPAHQNLPPYIGQQCNQPLLNNLPAPLIVPNLPYPKSECPYNIQPPCLNNPLPCAQTPQLSCSKAQMNIPQLPCSQSQMNVIPQLACSQPVLNIPQTSCSQSIVSIPQLPCSQSILNIPQLSCSQPLVNLPQVIPTYGNIPQISPTVSTSVVDNTLASSLANALQLLIFSNLIENTLGCSGGSLNLGFDTPCANNFEVISSDFYPICDVAPYPVVCETTCYQEPVVYQAPCVAEVSPVSPVNCASCFGSQFPVIDGYCGDNFQTSFVVEPCITSRTQSFSGCLEPAVANIAPMAIDVPFPTAIPAQLRCNVGYMPTSVPCVTVNVEPMPLNECPNVFGNGLFY